MRIAHISDLHIFEPSSIKLSGLLSKRITGLFNLYTFRKNKYSFNVFQRLVDDIIDENPDHVICTGDISNLALDSEFEKAKNILQLIGGYRKLSVIPGNHDYYTAGAVRSRRFESYFFPYMFKHFSDLDVNLYPYIKEVGNVVIAGLCSAINTLPLLAYGRIDHKQIGKLIEQLSKPRYDNKFKILIFHHNLHKRNYVDDILDGLVNKKEIFNLIRELKPDMVLYGHDHDYHNFVVENAGKKTYIFCNGSSTRIDEDNNKVARYNIYTIENNKFQDVETKIFDIQKRKFIWQFQ